MTIPPSSRKSLSRQDRISSSCSLETFAFFRGINRDRIEKKSRRASGESGDLREKFTALCLKSERGKKEGASEAVKLVCM